MRAKNISTKSNQILSYFNQMDKDCFVYAEAKNALPQSSDGGLKELLSDMVKRGLLMRLKKGLYYIIPFEKETLSAEQVFNEYLMMSLRTIQGCDLNFINKRFGHNLYLHCKKQAKPFLDIDQIRIENEKMHLTEKGKFFADKIASEIFVIE